MSSHECFDITIEGRVAHLVLNRPEKRNSMIPVFWEDFPRAIRELDQGGHARVVVISSTGPHFCSGLDVVAFNMGAARDDSDPDGARRARIQHGPRFYANVLRMQRSLSVLEESRLPVLAAVQGGCIGGGVDLTTACDMRYASADAFFTIFETNIGMTADVGTFPRIVKLIPEGVVRELAYTGRRMHADEAQRVGLVNRVYPDQTTLLAGVLEIAHEIASKAPLAVYGCKRMINYSRDHSTADGLDYIGIWNASMLQSEEIREAMSANREKRPGDFVDLPRVDGTDETSFLES